MPAMKRLFVTGNSAGLGLGLSEVFLDHGWDVYGCSRRGCALPLVHDARCDLSDPGRTGGALEDLLKGVGRLDLVILNAGVAGEVGPISQSSLDGLRGIFELNLWANKRLLDWLMGSGIQIDQIVLISSDSLELADKGWGGCALSKAALNTLVRLYALELPGVHFCAVAPGLISSSAEAAAERIFKLLPHLREYESGSFINIRRILAPDEYERLMDVSMPT